MPRGANEGWRAIYQQHQCDCADMISAMVPVACYQPERFCKVFVMSNNALNGDLLWPCSQAGSSTCASLRQEGVRLAGISYAPNFR
jgi:hypothetical protein